MKSAKLKVGAKSKKKLILALIGVCLFSIAAIFAVVSVLGLTTATAQTNLTVTYTVSGNVHADVSCDYAVSELDEPLLSSSFASIGSIQSFTPTQSNAKAQKSITSPSISFDAYEYFVLRYKFENKSENTDYILQATPVLIGSNIQAFYFQAQNTNQTLLGNFQTGGLSSPSATKLNSANVQSSSSYNLSSLSPTKFYIATQQTKYIYIVVSAKNVGNQMTFSALNWDMTAEEANNVTITINPSQVLLSSTPNTNNATALGATKLAGSDDLSISNVNLNSNLKTVLDNFVSSNSGFASSYSCWFNSNSCDEFLEDWDCVASLPKVSSNSNSTLAVYSHTKNLRADNPNAKIYFPFSTTSITQNSISGTKSNVIEVYIPKSVSVTTIGSYSFYNCSNLTKINIPSSVTTIGNSAFSSCLRLVEICNLSNLYIQAGESYTNTSNQNTGLGQYAKYVYGSNGSTRLSTSNGVVYYTEIENNVTNKIAVGPADLNTSSLTIDADCTEINQYAFYLCKNLTGVTISNSVTTIGDYVFWKCSGITSVTIPNSVTTIGAYTFSNCSGLTSITIPDSVTTIGNNAFNSCYRLVEVCNLSSLYVTLGRSNYGYLAYYAKDIYTIANYESKLKIDTTNGLIWYNDTANNKKIVIGPTNLNATNIIVPDGYDEINQYAFYSCSNLKSVTLQNSVTNIDDYAFSGCSKLQTIIIPNSIKVIGSSAFSSCNNLTYYVEDNVKYLGNDGNHYLVLAKINDTSISSFEINSNTRIIYDSAFSGCSSLTTIMVPDSVTSIGKAAFSGCSGLTSMTLPFVGGSKDATSASESTQFGYIFGKSSGAGLTSVTQQWYDTNTYSYYQPTYYIPSGLTTIIITGGNILYGAFYRCSMLTSVTIPSSLTAISEYAFYGCSGLTSITIPNSVHSIEFYAFRACSNLTSVTFENMTGWWVSRIAYAPSGTGTDVNVTNESTNATYLKTTYFDYYWERS